MECNLTAILLSLRESGTADRVAVFFSREKGKVRVFCPGSRRKGGRGGALCLFSALDIQLDFWQGSYQLVEAEALESYEGICTDWERLAYGAVLAESVEHLWPEEEAQPEVYEFLRKAFRALEKRSPRVAAAAALWQILELAGFGSDFEHCAHCGEPLIAGRLDVENGGMKGSCCLKSDSGGGVTPEELEVLRALRDYPWEEEKSRRSISGRHLVGAERILLEYLQYHLERPLKSLQFLQKMENNSRNLSSLPE